MLLDGLDLDVRPGEIVGVAGVEGNGQRTARRRAVEPASTLDAGTVEVDGRSQSRPGAPARWRAAGVAVIPEDRHDSGCVLDLSVAENLILAHPDRSPDAGFIEQARRCARPAELMSDFDVRRRRARRADVVAVGRQPAARDPGPRAVATIPWCSSPRSRHAVSTSARSSTCRRGCARSPRRGVGVLLISTELEEILDLSDRIVVLSKGRIVGEMTRATLDLERLGLLMGGSIGRRRAATDA